MKNIGIFLAVAGLLVGCARQDDTTSTTQSDSVITNRTGVGAPAGTETGAAGSRPDDTRITQAVQNAINMGALGRQGDLQVTVQNGVVTLKGSVATQQEKQDMEARAKVISGVSRVDNQLEVKAQGEVQPPTQQGQPQQGQPRQPQQGQPPQTQPQPQ